MSFPLILVCGTTAAARVLRPSRAVQCPVCAAHAVQLIEHSTRCCFCFIPLCHVGGVALVAECSSCGARMPPSVAATALVPVTSAPHAPAGAEGGEVDAM